MHARSAAPEDRQLVHSWRKTASVATLVDRLFGGIIVSSLQCSTCNATRIGFEPFLDLSLPIPDGVVSANSGVHSGPSVARETKKSKQEVKRERKRKKKNFRRESFRTPRPEEDIHSDPPASPDRVISDLDAADPRDSDSSIPFVPCESPIPPTNTIIDYTPSPQNSHQLDNIDGSSCVGSDNENGPLHSESLSSLSSKHHSPTKTSGSDERDGLSDCTTESVPVHQLSKLTLTPTQPDLFDSDELTQAIRFSQLPLRSSKATSSIASDVVTLDACLAKFTAPEHLTDLNRSVCEACCAANKTADRAGVIHSKPSQVVDFKNVVRRDMILEPPFLLTIHFKRFQQSGNRLRKSQRHVLFPILLDLSPFCSALYLSPVDSMLYRLYGVVEHMGSMTRGHYVAYVAASPDGPEVTNSGDSLRLQPDMQRILNMLHRPVKWPLTPHDLVQRLRTCDREQLLESLARSSSLPFSDSESTFDPNLNPPDGGANLDDRPWYRCSDDQVTKVPLSDVLNCQAFLLFYERIAT
ncbi:unnamed protein product [Dicrocoelium dendriticum]|nr:unnamed protein product [Dicrocoelium dendriticum]